MPTFNWELSIWNIVAYLLGVAILAIKMFHAADKRISMLSQILKTHGETLIQHASRMDVHENRILSIIENTARLAGRTEAR
jgi:hypothetical protein